jgi:GNAT superfamily N-acetyltransferase
VSIAPEANAGQPTGVRVSTDPADIDLDWLQPALSERAYWALGRTRENLERAIERSLPFVALRDERQIGFARVVTDGVTFGWICDVFVDEAERGRGVGHLLMAAIAADPRLVSLRRLILATRDAHELYARHGFVSLRHPERWMERPGPSTG